MKQEVTLLRKKSWPDIVLQILVMPYYYVEVNTCMYDVIKKIKLYYFFYLKFSIL